MQVEPIGITCELKVECERKRHMPSSTLELVHTSLGELIVPSLLTSAHSEVGVCEGCMISEVCCVTKVNLLIQKKTIFSAII